MFFRSLSFASAACALAIGLCHAQDADDLFKGGVAQPKRSAPPSNQPSQSQLAHKGAFPTVAASDPAFRHALPATNLAAAKAKLNQNAIFSGTVAKVYIPGGNTRVLLDFAANYKTAVIGLIDHKNFAQFPDLRALQGKRVLVSGRVISYKDQTQIDLRAPSSIRLVK